MATIFYPNVLTAKLADGGVDNATGTITIAAVAGTRHVIVGVLAEYDGDVQGKLIQVKDGATIKHELPMMQRPFQLGFGAAPLMRGSRSGACSVVLAASGTAGIKGYASVVYFEDPGV